MKSEIFRGICFSTILTVIIFGILYYCLAPEVWNVGIHDSKCEMNGDCHCYERSLEK